MGNIRMSVGECNPKPVKNFIDDSKLVTYNRQMYIKRDITSRLSQSTMPAQFVIGPRQCGKSTLLSHIGETLFKEITFDDLQLRNLANRDPALFLEQFTPPVLLDEMQYVPNLFSEIKRQIDQLKKQRLKDGRALSTLYRMTGSNQLLIDKNISVPMKSKNFMLSNA